MSTDFGLSQIGQIAITVTDVPRAIAFYRDNLGLKFLFEAPNLGFFDCAGIRLMLTLPEGTSGTHASILYYKVPDIQQAHEVLSGRGVAFEGAPHLIAKMPDHDLWMAFFRDPDSNILALMSEVPKR
jgi:catechol 2,3-dioxygenase-like lactoylglutathione lyase family enzyme